SARMLPSVLSMPLAARARSSMMRLSNCMAQVWEGAPALATPRRRGVAPQAWPAYNRRAGHPPPEGFVALMIVVTGGAGFIGSNLVAALEAQGAGDIAICDRLGSDAKWRNVAKRALADIVAPDRLFDFLAAYGREIEMVFHLGAISTTTERDVDLIVAEN